MFSPYTAANMPAVIIVFMLTALRGGNYALQYIGPIRLKPFYFKMAPPFLQLEGIVSPLKISPQTVPGTRL